MVQYSTEILDTWGGPYLSKLTECGAKDLTAENYHLAGIFNTIVMGLRPNGNCSASLVADKLTSRRDVSCGGEGPWGVDFGCIVRQFVSEPHDDAARRSLHRFPFREGCLDCGPAGAG